MLRDARRSFGLSGLLMLVLLSRASAQSIPDMRSVCSRGLSNATVAFGTAGVLDANPALSQIDREHMSVVTAGFIPNVAGLEHSDELLGTLALRTNVSELVASLGFARYHYSDLFGDQTVAIGVSRVFAVDSLRSASAGVRARYVRMSFGGAAPDLSQLLVDAGMRFAISPQFAIGASAENLLGATHDVIDGTREAYARMFIGGAAYHAADADVTLGAEVEAIVNEHSRLRFGIEDRLEQFLVLRAGAATDPSEFSGGVGFRFHAFSLDAAAQYSSLVTVLSLEIGWQW